MFPCSRWIHKECVENVIQDANGKGLLCPVCLSSGQCSISSGFKKTHYDPLCTIIVYLYCAVQKCALWSIIDVRKSMDGRQMMVPVVDNQYSRGIFC